MAWIGVITNAGAVLLAQWAAGDHTLTIDGAKVGSGFVQEANMRIMTDLSSEEDGAEIVSAEREEGGTQFRVRVSATDGESYTAHEIGLWAHIDDEEPVMIAYHQDSEIGVTIPTAASMPGFFFDLYCVHAIGNEGDLTIVLSNTSFATRDELTQLEETVDSIIQQSAFEIVVRDNEYILYWHGVEAECPYSIIERNGEYILVYEFDSAS